MVAPRQQYKVLHVLDSEDKARIVFVYSGVKECQIGSNLRSHKRKSACAEGALDGRTRKGPRNTLKQEKATESARELD